MHFKFRSPYFFFDGDLLLILVEKLIRLEPTHTGDYFRSILRDIVYLDDSFDRTVLLQGSGVKNIDFEFN